MHGKFDSDARRKNLICVDIQKYQCVRQYLIEKFGGKTPRDISQAAM